VVRVSVVKASPTVQRRLVKRTVPERVALRVRSTWWGRLGLRAWAVVVKALGRG